MTRKSIIVTIVLIFLAILGVFLWKARDMNNAANSSPATTLPPTEGQPNVQGRQAPQIQASESVASPKISTNTRTSMKHLVTLKTTLGDIQFETYDSDAPKAVNNFIALANKKFYDGVIFHRVIKSFMIQGGDPTGTGSGGPGYQFEDELNPGTASYKIGYKKGVVAMANAGPNTNGSQFFIMLADTALPHDYTIFGAVVKGQDVVDAIGNLPTDGGDRPLNPPAIESVIVAEE
jgi:cyclophilin family peptidyl-prolyl cis-trans isomerase